MSFFGLTLKLTLELSCLWKCCILFVRWTDLLWLAFYCLQGFLNFLLKRCFHFSLYELCPGFKQRCFFVSGHMSHVFFFVQVCISSRPQRLRMSSVVQDKMCLIESTQRKWTNTYTHSMTSPSPPHRFFLLNLSIKINYCLVGHHNHRHN